MPNGKLKHALLGGVARFESNAMDASLRVAARALNGHLGDE